jgi:predicted lipoprotein with Yx(FWY)xxD motif
MTHLTQRFRRGSTSALWLGAPVIALVAACGAASTPAATSGAGTGTGSGPMTITAKQTSLGSVLTGPNGDTLYTLLSSSGTPIPCTGACATAWPPLTAAAGASIQAGSGVSATLAVSTGATQVSADGTPLYYFSGDTAPGQVNGQDLKSFGGTWFAIQASGQPVSAASASTPGSAATPTPTPSSGNPYGY